MSESPTPPSSEPLNVFTVTAVMLDQMASLAWQKMGLQHDPMTGTLDKDLLQARAAIDVAEALAKVLEGQLDEEDRRHTHNLLRDLKLNFVEQSK